MVAEPNELDAQIAARTNRGELFTPDEAAAIRQRAGDNADVLRLLSVIDGMDQALDLFKGDDAQARAQAFREAAEIAEGFGVNAYPSTIAAAIRARAEERTP